MTVNQLETNARFVGFLLVRSADARTDKKGASYLDLTLADKTGDINCKYWDWNHQSAGAGAGVQQPQAAPH